MQNQLYNLYQQENPEKFNEDLIYIREKEDVDSYFRDLFTTLSSIPGISFVDMRRVSEEEAAELVPKRTIPMEESKLDLIEAIFRIEWAGEVKERKLHLFIPRLVDDFFFVLNGNRYYAILQLADKNWYTVRNGVYLKTLLMPLGVKHKLATIEDEDGREYTGKVFMLDFFKSKAGGTTNLKNFLLYFFVEYGFQETIELFGLDEDLFVSTPDELADPDFASEFSVFNIHRGVAMMVNRERMIEDETFRNLAVTFYKAIEQHAKKVSSTESRDFWRRKILNSPTAKIDRADKTIASLKRILDERTKKNLREIPEGQKDSSFDVVRYMVTNYEELYAIDGVDIYTRRIRLFEYLLFPLLLKWSEIAIRILNSRNVDMKRLETTFSNIGAMFLVKRLITNELLRYSNVTNALNLFNVALKWSARGPQSLGANGADMPLKYRSVHESFIGNLSLNASSASDPGTSGTIVPFCNNIDRMFFERPNPTK